MVIILEILFLSVMLSHRGESIKQRMALSAGGNPCFSYSATDRF